MEQKIDSLSPEKKDSKEEKQKVDSLVILSYLGIFLFIPLLTRRNDEFCQYHLKQGLVLFFGEIIAVFLFGLPVIGWLVGYFALISLIVLSVLGILNVLQGEKKPLPWFGKFAEKIKFSN
jgi:uncharacterized membrane protein